LAKSLGAKSFSTSNIQHSNPISIRRRSASYGVTRGVELFSSSFIGNWIWTLAVGSSFLFS
jgi:hypothetical protein